MWILFVADPAKSIAGTDPIWISKGTRFSLFAPGTEPGDGVAAIECYSIRGSRVAGLQPIQESGGFFRFTWNGVNAKGVDLPYGLYWLTITFPGRFHERYAWLVRYSATGHSGEAGLSSMLLEPKNAWKMSPSSWSHPEEYPVSCSPSADGFLDETDRRLPAIEDETARIVAADIDGDEDIDIVLAEYGPVVKQNKIWINDGRGFFADETSTRLPEIEDFSNDLDVADIDGDDDLDIVVANSLFEESYVLTNDGDGFFTQIPGSLPTFMDDSWGVRFCDVTGDDRPDIVFANVLGRNRLFFNDGIGNFTDVSEDHLPSDFDDTYEVCCQDVNGDSANDIVFLNLDINFGLQNRLLINDGTGHFSDSTSGLMPDIRDGSFDGELIDIDGDRWRDLIVADKWIFDDSTGVIIPGSGKNLALINHSPSRPGLFIDESVSRMPDLFDWTNGVAVADVDGQDGPDLVFANGDFGQGAINRMYLNDGNGFFTDATGSWLPHQEELSTDVVLFDADGDGDNDMVVANIPPDTILANAQNRLLINQTIVGIGDLPEGPSLPAAFALSQNYPNPFNPRTTVEVNIPEGSQGKTFIGIYSVRGRLVKVIEDQTLPAGQYRFTWDGRGDAGEPLPSGIYLLTLKSRDTILTRKMSLVK